MMNCGSLVGVAVLIRDLEPHRVEDREGAGKPEAQYLAEIPHRTEFPAQ